jgi:hypothetical protein
VSTPDEECIGYARECVRLAGLTKDQVLREQLLDMARNWMAEAMHEKQPPPAGRAVGDRSIEEAGRAR